MGGGGGGVGRKVKENNSGIGEICGEGIRWGCVAEFDVGGR